MDGNFDDSLWSDDGAFQVSPGLSGVRELASSELGGGSSGRGVGGGCGGEDSNEEDEDEGEDFGELGRSGSNEDDELLLSYAHARPGAADSLQDQRRQRHTKAEQKRREAIKRGYDRLCALVPKSHSDQKISKAAILQKSTDYLRWLANDEVRLQAQLDELRLEEQAHQQMLAAVQNLAAQSSDGDDGRLSADGQHGERQRVARLKVVVYQRLLDRLFQSFDQQVDARDFQQLSATYLHWLISHCKPQNLQHLLTDILNVLATSAE